MTARRERDPFAVLNDADRFPKIDPAYDPDEQTFPRGEAVCVARFPARCADGRDAAVLERRLPARFFEVVVEGDGRPGYRVGTGSGDDMGRLAFRLARLIADGLLGWDAIPAGGA